MSQLILLFAGRVEVAASCRLWCYNTVGSRNPI